MSYPDGFIYATHSQKPICGILAVAIAANVPFDVAEKAVRNNLIKNRQRFTGTTYHEERMAALKELGVRYKEINFQRTSLAKYIRENCDLSKKYMLNVTGHVLMLVDGKLIDQSEIHEFEKHWAKRKFIRNIVEIL